MLALVDLRILPLFMTWSPSTLHRSIVFCPFLAISESLHFSPSVLLPLASSTPHESQPFIRSRARSYFMRTDWGSPRI